MQLWVPFDDPGTLYYDLGDPSIIRMASAGRPGIPRTRVERALCLCLMSFRSSCRNHAWRENTRGKLQTWYSSFDSVRLQIPITESHQSAQNMESTSSGHSNSEQATSEYLPSSSSAGSPVPGGHRMATRSGLGCAPSSDQPHREDSSDSDADPNTSTGQKRGFRKVEPSPPTRRCARRTDIGGSQGKQFYLHVAQFCTQKCLLGLQQGGVIDPCCPNAELHISGRQDDRHPIDVKTLVQMVKEQLDEDLDHNFTPMGDRGSYAAPFKVTCAAYGYTIVGKATTSRCWKVVSSEADVYRILRPVQGSAVPVFLGAIDLDRVYFLHGAGEIRHMLLMGWGGEDLSHLKSGNSLDHAISRSLKKIRSLGIIHQDLRPENILWNAELNRALIIDFHRCTLRQQPMHRRPGSNKRPRNAAQEHDHKRVREV